MSTLTLQQGVNSYAGCIDTLIRLGNPTNNGGASTTITVCAYQAGTGDYTSSLVKFDLTGLFTGTETVSSATLGMYFTGWENGSNNKTIGIAATRRAWIEGTGTGLGGSAANSGEPCWNYYSYNTGAWTTAGALDTANDIYTDDSSVNISASTTVNAFLNFDVTNSVQKFINGTYTNNGWLLHCTAGDNNNGRADFSSRNNATTANRPTLTINYTSGGATTLPLLTLIGVGV